jgi:hypothetical protein
VEEKQSTVSEVIRCFDGGRGDGTVEEKQSTVSEVIRCFGFGEKRGRGNTRFGRGKEHARRLLVPRRGATGRCSGATVCGGGRQPYLGSVWIDVKWKTTNRACWAERVFGPDTVVKIKHMSKINHFYVFIIQDYVV